MRHCYWSPGQKKAAESFPNINYSRIGCPLAFCPKDILPVVTSNSVLAITREKHGQNGKTFIAASSLVDFYSSRSIQLTPSEWEHRMLNAGAGKERKQSLQNYAGRDYALFAFDIFFKAVLSKRGRLCKRQSYWVCMSWIQHQNLSLYRVTSTDLQQALLTLYLGEFLPSVRIYSLPCSRILMRDTSVELRFSWIICHR